MYFLMVDEVDIKSSTWKMVEDSDLNSWYTSTSITMVLDSTTCWGKRYTQTRFISRHFSLGWVIIRMHTWKMYIGRYLYDLPSPQIWCPKNVHPYDPSPKRPMDIFLGYIRIVNDPKRTLLWVFLTKINHQC